MKTPGIFKKLQRRFQLKLLENARPEALLALGEKKMLRAFRKSGNSSPALRKILQSHRIDPESVTSPEAFSALDFTLSKENTFNEFSLDELCRPGVLDKLSSVLTSSGHSGNFAFGLSSWRQTEKIPDLIDLALESAFQIDRKKSLLVNCLPMGVRFPSNTVTQAEVSVREDMALALISKFSPFYDQLIIVCDPLFLKLLMDTAQEWSIDWGRIHKNLIIGEESFGENFRNYVGRQLHIDPDDPTTGIIGSSMGVGELGLNLCFETPETIALRRLINRTPALKSKLFGCHSDADPLPMLFAYNPLAFHLETCDRGPDGYGALLVSILEDDCPIPLFRYRTGDEARLLNGDDIRTAFQAQGMTCPALPKLPLLCVRGRDRDRLDDSGLHMGAVKDALYQDMGFADRITGAFRIEKDKPAQIHIQLRPGIRPDAVSLSGIFSGDHLLFSTGEIRLWDYDQFPYGKTIDYERKFRYLA